MERYSSYKPTSMQWLKEIPSHWEEMRVKYITNISKGNGITKLDVSSDGDTPCVRYGEIYTKYNNTFKFCHSATFKNLISSPRYFEYGDILVSGTGELVEEIGKSVVYIGDEKCLAGGDIIILKHNQNPIFLNYALNTKYTQDQKSFGKAKLKVVHISSSEIGRLFIALPPLAEQEKIVGYLEDKTSKIDAYVADKEKEIELLQELKQKTIADAVTKGLNPDAKMKDSGISWIGEIPEHWDTRRAKFMFKKNKRERRPEDEVITCFRDGQVTLRKNRRLTGFTESEKYDGYQGIRKGDLVIHQMDAFAGSIGVSDSDGMGTSVYHCCTPTGDYNVYYYANLIRQMALSGFIQSLYKGIRERSSDFSFPVFGNQYLTIPPLDEQQAIVSYIEEKCEKIAKLASELQSEIDYLKEYKQRLIADCVTGQVNVQNV